MTSPLEGVNHQTLDELFSRDPLTLADADLDAIVANLRKMREEWAKGEEATQTAPKKKASPKKLSESEFAELTKQLGL